MDGIEQADWLWEQYVTRGGEAFADVFDECAVIEEWDEAPGAQTWHGPEGARALLDRWAADLDEFHFERTGETVDLGGGYFTLPVRATGRGRSSGVEIDWRLWLVNHVREGRLDWIAYTESLEEAREKADARRR
ncbi:MAG: hypothetical protein H0V29_02815 [Thermoleophilaceae bacterium]|nr:hypothetical protein [Thermoleophilaceae bacterium]